MLILGIRGPESRRGKKNKVFSLKFDVISPWDNRCKYQRNSTKCEIELSGVVEDVQVENLEDGMRYVMPIEIGANKQAFRVRCSNDNATWRIEISYLAGIKYT